MRFIIFVFFQFVITTCVVCQSTLNRATYQANHKFLSSDVFNGLNTLYFDKKRSKYIHNNYPVKTSIRENNNLVKVKAGDPERFPIYISLEDSLIIGKVRGLPSKANNISIIEERLNPIPWRITSEQKIIRGYKTIKATTQYEGRSYVAWFAPAIPVPFGPYRLHGLPGLIIEASSDDDQVNWTLESFDQITNRKTLLDEPKFGDRYTWQELVEARIAEKHRTESKSSMDWTITINDPNPNSFIERDKFSIFKHYLND